jgi:hypothetical protein
LPQTLGKVHEKKRRAPALLRFVRTVAAEDAFQTIESDFFSLTGKKPHVILCRCHASCDWNFQVLCIVSGVTPSFIFGSEKICAPTPVSTV